MEKNLAIYKQNGIIRKESFETLPEARKFLLELQEGNKGEPLAMITSDKLLMPIQRKGLDDNESSLVLLHLLREVDIEYRDLEMGPDPFKLERTHTD